MKSWMFQWFKRKRSKPPAVEWGNGKARAVNILDALANSADAKISRYSHGVLEWTHDAAKELHAFTCDCVEAVLDDVGVERMPVYVGTPREARDAWSAAKSMAEEPTEQNRSIRRIHYELPTVYRDALEVKRRWLSGAASAEDFREVAERVSGHVQTMWPSNFCLSVNAMRFAGWSVLSALDLESPGFAAHGCAQCTAWFMGARRACDAMNCSGVEADVQTLVWEAAQLGARFEGRGVGCPQVDDKRAEELASETMEKTVQKWWTGLGDKLAERIQKAQAGG
jgi:hypothetical protein